MFLSLSACQETRNVTSRIERDFECVYPRAILKMGSINRYSERRAEPAFNFSRSNGFASSSRRMHRDVSPASHRSAFSDRSEKPHIRICMIEESLGAAAGYAILIPSPTTWPVLTPERSTIRTISRLPVTFPSGHDPSESRDRPGLVVFRFLSRFYVCSVDGGLLSVPGQDP